MTMAMQEPEPKRHMSKQRKVQAAKAAQKRQDGEATTLPVDSIRIDSDYQRSLDTRRVNFIVHNWDSQLAGALVVNVRGGIIWCVDGQHRLAAMVELGIKSANVVKFVGLTQKEEAELFIRYNKTSKPLKAWDWFSAQLVARDPDALAIKSAVQRAGFEIAASATGETAIEAVAAMKRIYRLGGDGLIASTLAIVHQHWLGLRKNRSANTLEGLALFLYSEKPEPNFDPGRLEVLLQGMSPTSLLRDAGEVAAKENKASINGQVVAQALVDRFNERLAKKNRLPRYIRKVAPPA